MNSLVPKGTSRDDSIAITKLYIDNWIKTRLLLQRAELNLTGEQANVNREIETYRTSLLIYKYEQLLLLEKLDTAVLDSEIESYYQANTANFVADELAVKAIYLKLRAGAPELWNVRRWLASDRDSDIQALTEYSRSYAEAFDLFGGEWIPWQRIESELPSKEAAARQLAYSNQVEQQNDSAIWLVRILEKRAAGETAPLSFVKNKIKSIIINQRKLDFLVNLEQDIYNDALLKKQFEIYPAQ
jgi:hypothetical protein